MKNVCMTEDVILSHALANFDLLCHSAHKSNFPRKIRPIIISYHSLSLTRSTEITLTRSMPLKDLEKAEVTCLVDNSADSWYIVHLWVKTGLPSRFSFVILKLVHSM